VILIHQRHRQTDRRTDGQHAISIPRYALVHRAVKIKAKLKKPLKTNNQQTEGGRLKWRAQTLHSATI